MGYTIFEDRRILAINIIFDPDPGLLEWPEFLSIRTMALNLYFWATASKLFGDDDND